MEMTLGRSRGGPVALIAGIALLCVVGAFLLGLIQTIGYEKRSVAFTGAASSTKAGGGFGLKYMLFFRGQTFFADYETEVRDGALRIGIIKLGGSSNDRPHFAESITESGAGEVAYRIPETGLYSIYFNGTVLGNNPNGRYDVSYSVRWGVR